jgi:hypothetical protein
MFRRGFATVRRATHQPVDHTRERAEAGDEQADGEPVNIEADEVKIRRATAAE